MYQRNSMPRNQVEEIQNLVSSLLIEIQEDLECILNFCKEPFKEFKTEYKFLKMLRDFNEKAFHHLVEELKQLEVGVELIIENEVKIVHFVLSLIVGVNLAVNSILGFVQPFNSKRYCRA